MSTIFILFAGGGWLEFDPDKRKLKDSGTDWEDYFSSHVVAPSRMFRAVNVLDDFPEIRKDIPSSFTVTCF